VLVAGGYDGFNFLTSAELFNPATGKLQLGRDGHDVRPALRRCWGNAS
jgi:hypothetical protein